MATDLSNLRNAVHNDVVRKTRYSKLSTKVNSFDTKVPSTSGLISKLKNDLDKQNLKKKIENVDKKIHNTNFSQQNFFKMQTLWRLKIKT